MQQYLDACRQIVREGAYKQGRNGGYYSVHGMMMKFNLQDGFPAVTTKKLHFKSVVAELLGFIRGANNNREFQGLGTEIWTPNAESEYWKASPYNKGDGDLGRIYGAHWRAWRTAYEVFDPDSPQDWSVTFVDQLAIMVDKLKKGIDDRRNIVTAWNPGELDQAALPPCHVLYQAHTAEGFLDLTMFQRSCDFPLGVPFNIASYALLMHILCRISGLQPGTLTWMGGDCHIYENQLALMEVVQLLREPMELPSLYMSPRLKTLQDFETHATWKDFELLCYNHHPEIKYPFSV